MKKFTLAACLCILMSISASNAIATVIWDESIDGDLGIGAAAISVGDLQLGINTFLGSGSLTRVNGGSVSADVDHVLFNLTDNLIITTMTGELTNLLESAGSSLGTRMATLGYSPPASPNIVQYDMISNSAGIYLLPVATVGEYRLTSGGGGASVADNVDISWDWRIDINVAAVPAPTVLGLMSIGLLGVGAATKRRNRKH